MTLFPTIILNSLEDTFLNWAWANFPTIVSVGVAMWLTWWARGRFIDYRNRFIKTETDCGKLNNNQIALNTRLVSIDTKLTTLIIHLSSTKKIDSNLFKSQSPIELTDAGTKILIEMGGKAYVDTCLHVLLEAMESQSFKSGLDVQNFSTVLLNEKINENELIPIKNYIFSHPIYRLDDKIKIPLDLTVAITIMGIYLRNRYFEKHPELRSGM